MSEEYTIKEMLEHFMEDTKETLGRIEGQTTKTNGRVTSLEKSRNQMWGAYIMLTLLGGAIITLAVMAIDSKIQKGIEQAFINRVDKVTISPE